MKNTILTESNYIDFYKGAFFGDMSEPIKAAIIPAYRDLCRTITGFSKKYDKDTIKLAAQQSIYDSILLLLKTENINQQIFDNWHKSSCEKLIAIFGTQKFTYGQAQKWINMTMKYLSMISHSSVKKCYEYCHIPIDNYILQATSKTLSTTWSRLEDYDEYLSFQNWFRETYDGIPLDVEFTMWLKEARYSKK
jgi:hypothetical protein